MMKKNSLKKPGSINADVSFEESLLNEVEWSLNDGFGAADSHMEKITVADAIARKKRAFIVMNTGTMEEMNPSVILIDFSEGGDCMFTEFFHYESSGWYEILTREDVDEIESSGITFMTSCRQDPSVDMQAIPSSLGVCLMAGASCREVAESIINDDHTGISNKYLKIFNDASSGNVNQIKPVSISMMIETSKVIH